MKKIIFSLILALSISAFATVNADTTTTPVPEASPEMTTEPIDSPEVSAEPEASPEAPAEAAATPTPAPAEEAIGNFIALFNNSSSVIRNDENGKLIIAEAQDSNKTAKKAFINDAGRTMVPFRYLAEELLGLSDYSEENNTEYFKFDGGAIVIKYNGTEFMKAQNTPFNMTIEDKDETFVIENKDGSLYFPLRVLETIFGVYVKWDAQTGSIIFATNEKTASEYSKESEQNKLDFCDEYDKLYSYNFYNNPMNYSDIYMHSKDVQKPKKSVKEQTAGEASYYGVTRILDTLYFTDENGNICSMNENGKTPEIIVPVEENAHYADYVMAVKHGELYGISAPVSGGYMGTLCKYTLNNDGTWSKAPWVTSSNEVLNPIYWNGNMYYIVNNSGIYQKSLNDQQEICLLEKSDISFFAVNNDYIAVVDLDGKLICYNRADGCSEETAKHYDEYNNFISLALYESYEGEVKKNIMYAVTVEDEENKFLGINMENMETSEIKSFGNMPIKRLALIEGHPYAIIDGKVTDLLAQ